MPVSADQTQIGIVKEVTYGVTPPTPVFQILIITGESLAGNANTELSQSLNPNRQVLDSILQSLDVAGSLDFEFAKTPAMDMLIESAMAKPASIAGTDYSYVVGGEQISYTIEKRWPDPKNLGEFLYHRFTGCVVNTYTLTMAAGESVTGSGEIIGQAVVTDTALIAGATYVEPTTFNVFRGPDVTQILLDNEAGTLAPTLTDSCVTDITININNNYRGIQCLGFTGNKETVLGQMECNYDQTIFFSSNSIMDSFLVQDLLLESITLGDDSGDDHYKFITTKGKLASEEVVAGGTGTDVVNNTNINWLYDGTIAVPTTLEITTTDGAGPVAPAYTSSSVENAAANDLVITYDAGVAVTDQTGFSVDINAGTPNVVTNAVASGNTITLTLTNPIVNGDAILLTYNNGTGNVVGSVGGAPAIALTDESVTNNVA